MEKNKMGDLQINGIGSSAGGHFNSVRINGKGEITGDLECSDLQINGLGHLVGDITAESARISGKSDIKGNIECNDISIDGKLDITGGVNANRIENEGMLGVTKDVNSDSFHSHGGFKIGGLLNADKIHVVIDTPCSANEIGGEEIDIRSGIRAGLKKLIGSFLLGRTLKPAFTTDTIEGDNIYLENTVAKTVRGNNVKIGSGCQIDVVEYKNSFKKEDNPNIRVNESKKI